MCSTSPSMPRSRCCGRPKQSRRRPAAQKKVLRELTENGTTLKILAGRYGPYVTDGTTNASIPKTTAPETLTYAQAVELLAARRDAAPALDEAVPGLAP